MSGPARSRLLAAAALCVLVVIAAGAVGGRAEAADTPAPFTVSNASLRWGVNDESNNGAFAPGTWNLFSAGVIGNPGAGAQTLRVANAGKTWSNGRAAGWTNRSGAVTIEDLRADGSYGPATFDGTRQNAAGQSTSPPGSAVVAETQVVLRAGTGTVDAAAGTATMSWRGSFSVLYYSGMTYYVVSNPILKVTPRSATLTATASGYATSMADQSKWQPVAATTVTLADFGALDLGGEKGFSATPRYSGVKYDAPSSGTSQVRSGASWGSFPASFVRFLEKVGMASYWYSSGGATDAKKVATPVTVSWDATAPVAAPARPVTAPQPTAAQPSVALAPPPPSQATPTVTRTTVVERPAPTRPTAAVVTTAPATAAAPSAAVVADRGPVTTLHAAPAAATGVRPVADRTWEWVLGGVLLAGAAALLLMPYLRRKARP